jgi:hypothetical protein
MIVEPRYRETLLRRVPLKRSASPIVRKRGRHAAEPDAVTKRAEKLARESHSHFASIQGRKHYGI